MEINRYLVKLIEAAKGLEKLDFFMGKATLSKTEFRLLQEVVISSELARRLGVTRSAVSQIVTKLEEKDIVKRTAAQFDRKIAYIRLSDYAYSMFVKQCEQANAAMEELGKQFGMERLDKFIDEYDELCKAFCKIVEAHKAEEQKKEA